MATKTIEIPEIGIVNLKKNSASKSIRISLPPNGEVNVSMPRWVPYSMAIKFVSNRKQWILDNKVQKKLFSDNQIIGKSHELRFKPSVSQRTITTRIMDNELWVKYPNSLDIDSPEVQQKTKLIAVRALRLQAEDILLSRLRDLAFQHGFEAKSIEIRNLKARWGSCNSKKEITLNLYLMLLPWELIDYVILHELSHTKAMHHGPDFWKVFEEALPDAKKKRKEIQQHKPAF